MEDLTKVLLENYYGFGGKKQEFKSISSYEAYQKELVEDKSVTDDLDKNCSQEDPLGVRPASEHRIDDSGDNNGMTNGLIRSWRALSINNNDFNDEILDLTSEEVDFEAKHSKKDIQDDGKLGSTKLATPEKEKGREDISEFGVNEDTLADNASEISTTSTKKKTRKKSSNLSTWCQPVQSLSLLPPIKSKKNPIITNEYCDMKDASIIEFPINLLEEISNIRMLYLENNCLNELPDQLFLTLKYLQWLDVRNNWLKTLPVTMKYHGCLETLLLQGNRIEKLPLELGTVLNLKALQLSGNPIIYPPSEIIAQGFSSIMRFLKQEWNTENPDEPVPSSYSTEVKSSSRLNALKSVKKLSTRNMSKSSQQVFSRERARTYKPSNRCRNSGGNSMLEEKLRWISKVREMLIKQAAELQSIKDQEVLNEWRRDKRSFNKSMKKAAARSQEVNPFTVSDHLLDVKELQKSELKHKNRRLFGDMDKKMFEITESLNRYDDKNDWSTALQLESVQLEIKKIEKLYEEIQALKRQNDTAYKKYTGPSKVSNNSKLYESPPSIII